MIERAERFLGEWLADTRDPDPEQRAWKLAYADGALRAYEQLGIAPADEVARWRARFASLGADEADAGDREAWTRALAYLDSVADDRERGMAAIEALRATGILDDSDYRYWLGRVLGPDAAAMPLDVSEGGWTAVAAYGPADDETSAPERPLTIPPQPGPVRRVLTGSPERHDGIAITAIIVHENAMAVHFHHVGEPMGRAGLELRGFTTSVDGLTPPALVDDRGGTYEATLERPNSANGTGGIPDPDRRRVITGWWLYTPAPPDDAQRFTVGDRWQIG